MATLGFSTCQSVATLGMSAPCKTYDGRKPVRRQKQRQQQQQIAYGHATYKSQLITHVVQSGIVHKIPIVIRMSRYVNNIMHDTVFRIRVAKITHTHNMATRIASYAIKQKQHNITPHIMRVATEMHRVIVRVKQSITHNV